MRSSHFTLRFAMGVFFRCDKKGFRDRLRYDVCSWLGRRESIIGCFRFDLFLKAKAKGGFNVRN